MIECSLESTIDRFRCALERDNEVQALQALLGYFRTFGDAPGLEDFSKVLYSYPKFHAVGFVERLLSTKEQGIQEHVPEVKAEPWPEPAYRVGNQLQHARGGWDCVVLKILDAQDLERIHDDGYSYLVKKVDGAEFVINETNLIEAPPVGS